MARVASQVRSAPASRSLEQYDGVYPGPRFSFDFFFRYEKIDPRPDHEISPAIRAPLAVFVGLPDLPVSLAFDTVLFPFDLTFWLISDESEEDSLDSAAAR